MSKGRGVTASEKILSRIPGSDALPGWGTLGVIYSIWFILHPKSITFFEVPVQENGTFFALIATISTYYIADYLDDIFWSRLKNRFWVTTQKKEMPSINELRDKRFLELGRGWGDILMKQVCNELEIVKGSYNIATKLLKAAKKDFWCKNVNELAKAARGLAIFALFYLLVPTFGGANEIYPYLSPVRLIFLGLIPIFVFLYIWLKEKQRFMYYQMTLHLIAQHQNSKFSETSLGKQRLFFWDGKFVTSAVTKKSK